MLAVCTATSSVPKEEPRSPRASRATRRCNRWSRPLGARTSFQVFAICHPLTRLLSHRPNLSHALQSLWQQYRRRGRLCTRCRPQGDADHQPEVRRRPRVSFLSAPIDTSLTWQILHSPCAHAMEVVCSRTHAHPLVPTQSRRQHLGWRDGLRQ